MLYTQNQLFFTSYYFDIFPLKKKVCGHFQLFLMSGSKDLCCSPSQLLLCEGSAMGGVPNKLQIRVKYTSMDYFHLKIRFMEILFNRFYIITTENSNCQPLCSVYLT